jgi:hypothetical protein
MRPKLFFAFFLTVAIFTTVNAQVFNVPAHAKTDFSERYKNATKADWTNDVSYYTCKFKQNGVDSKAYYHMDGYWDYTERFVASSKVPTTVKDSFSKSKYRDWSTKSLVYVENKDNVNLYRYYVKKGIEKKYVFFDKEGKLVKEHTTL